MDKVHTDLAKMLAAGLFEPFIRYIRFPRFRGLRDGTRIEFMHPVTVLVGPNGTNKTAILRALQGSPENANLGQYWFSTNLDPIRAADRHRFIYGYLAASVGEVVEVVKSRITREGDPDYWEPARPILQDGMQRMPPSKPGDPLPPERTATRWKAIAKSVVYLDFRSELSAYDKYFFHVPSRRKSAVLGAKKALIRKRSSHVARSLLTRRKSHTFYQSERIVQPAVTLDSELTAAISEILGREYDSIQILMHSYFDVQGATVIMRSLDLRYSEAFAGSGEFAVVMLVKSIAAAPSSSLILLDEPEVSLHPGAQQKLMTFISDQAKRRNLQVVISTHSPQIIRGLPPCAIKVFQRSETDGKVDLVAQESEQSEAFFRLGVDSKEKWTVYVEDVLAAAIVRKAARKLGQAANSRLQVRVLPGGAGSIKVQFLPNFALTERKRCLLLLDGDQRPATAPGSPSAVPDVDLEKAVFELLQCMVVLPLDGSSGTSVPGQKESQLRQVLSWCNSNLDFMPGSTPEALLTDMEGLAQAADPKSEWLERTRQALGREDWEVVASSDVLSEQERALARVPDDCDQLQWVRDRVRKFLQEEQ